MARNLIYKTLGLENISLYVVTLDLPRIPVTGSCLSSPPFTLQNAKFGKANT